VTDEDNDEDPVTATAVAYAYFNILLRLQDFTGEDYRSSSEHHPSKTSEEDDKVAIRVRPLVKVLITCFAGL